MNSNELLTLGFQPLMVNQTTTGSYHLWGTKFNPITTHVEGTLHVFPSSLDNDP
jgi:hypothetical protein